MTNKERAFELFKWYVSAHASHSDIEDEDRIRHFAKRACQAVDEFNRVAGEWWPDRKSRKCTRCAGAGLTRLGNSTITCVVCKGTGEAPDAES